jgi:hypothetical protein
VTILFVAGRASFAVIAVDGLETHFDVRTGEVVATRSVSKYLLASDPPLAVAESGFGALGGRPTIDVIEDIVIACDPDASSSQIGFTLARELGEVVGQEVATARAAGVDIPGMMVAIAQVRERADVAILVVSGPGEGEQSVFTKNTPEPAIFWPGCLTDFKQQRFSDPATRGASVNSRRALLAAARQVVTDGIETERGIHEGQNIHCGYPVDVVLVDRSGPRPQSFAGP